MTVLTFRLEPLFNWNFRIEDMKRIREMIGNQKSLSSFLSFFSGELEKRKNKLKWNELKDRKMTNWASHMDMARSEKKNSNKWESKREKSITKEHPDRFSYGKIVYVLCVPFLLHFFFFWCQQRNFSHQQCTPLYTRSIALWFAILFHFSFFSFFL